MRLVLFLSLSLFGSVCFAQGVTNHQVEPKGVYKDINLSNDARVIQSLLDTDFNHSRSALFFFKRNMMMLATGFI